MTRKLQAISAAVLQGRRFLLPPTDLLVGTGEVAIVHGPPGSSHAALGLALAGRIRLDSGSVTLSGDGRAGTRQRLVALVDVPEVNEPDDLIPWRVVIAEELAMAGLPSGPGPVRDWFAAPEDQNLDRALTQDVPGPARSDALLHLAAKRMAHQHASDGFLFWPLPERLGISPGQALGIARKMAQQGFGVILTTSHPVPGSPDDHFEIGAATPADPAGAEPHDASGPARPGQTASPAPTTKQEGGDEL